jgi:hypothetical protein
VPGGLNPGLNHPAPLMGHSERREGSPKVEQSDLQIWTRCGGIPKTIVGTCALSGKGEELRVDRTGWVGRPWTVSIGRDQVAAASGHTVEGESRKSNVQDKKTGFLIWRVLIKSCMFVRLHQRKIRVQVGYGTERRPRVSSLHF